MASTLPMKDFYDFVKAIGESKSKQEEDRIIADEVVNLKKVIPQQQTGGKKKLKELLVRAIYVEMLGQDASFAYIKAVELCASTNIIQKRVGYLMAYLCLSPTHEFRFMLINQIQRDMKSSNQLEACAALAATCKLATEDMIPAIIGDVVKLLIHEMESVRKRAVIALHRLYQLDKTCLIGQTDKVRKSLCDKDPSVMGGTLPLLLSLVQDDIASYKDLVPSLVSILKQITEHRLPKDYDYHRIPAPWIQMHLLRILALLGKGDQTSSEGMYEILVDVMKRADTGINVGYAIVYETVKTITTIYPNPTLLDAAATAISRFVRSDSHNLKYIGIKGLAEIVKEYPKYAADHQMAVIDCLEDPDETLKRKTLELLFRMTNSVNVEFIVEKLLSFLENAIDDHFRTDLVGQISQCAERYAPSNAWYVQTIVRVFELAGDKVKLSVAQTLTQLIAEGASDEDSDQDNPDDQLRMNAVEDFLELIENPKLSEILAQTMAWVLGEYGYLSESHTKEQIMEKLCHLAYNTNNPTTKAQVVTALMKLVAQNGSCPAKVTKLVNTYSESVSLDLQQRCLEFKALLLHPDTMVDVLPVDASCEDIEVDEKLSFLNSFVSRALAAGAVPYSPPNLDDDDDSSSQKSSGLKITPYERPAPPPAPAVGILASAGMPTQGPTPLGPAITNPSPVLSGPALQGNQLLNNRGTAAVWGKKPEPVIKTPEPTSSMVSTASISNHSNSSSSSSSSFSSPSPSVQAVPIGVTTPTIPELPKQKSEKEILAEALFGGVGGSNIDKKSNTRYSTTNRTSRRSSASNLTQSTPPTHSSPSIVPISMGDDTHNSMSLPTASSSVTSNLHQQVAGAVAVDLLDLGMTEPTTHVSTSSFTTPVQDFTQSQSISTTTSIPPVTPPRPPQPSISDAFSSIDFSSPSNTSLNTLSLGANLAYSTGAQPLQLTTNEFGQRWGQVPVELKQSVTTKIRVLDQLRNAIPSSYAHVESIQSTFEAIFAATASNGSVVLVHIKINQSKAICDVIVKASSRDICGRELSAIATALSSFAG